MTIQIIPISAVAAQTFTIQLGTQNCAISINQKSTGLFFDMALSGISVSTSVICLNLVGLIRSAYYGFSGQLFFVDTQGTSDPTYTGLGARFLLIYKT